MKKVKFSLILALSFVTFVFMACQMQGKGLKGKDTPGEGGGGGGGTPSGVTFDVQTNNLKCISGNFSIIPSNDEVTYAVGVMTKKKYEAESLKGDKKDPPVGIFSFDKSWYQLLAGQGGDWKAKAKEAGYYKTGVTSGSIVSPENINILDIRPNTECVIYYYLIKETSEVPDSEIFVHEFKTLPENLSTNTLEAKIDRAYSNGVRATITTTNDDSWFAFIARKKFLDWYLPGGSGEAKGFTLKDAIYKEISGRSSEGAPPLRTFNGNLTITPGNVIAPWGEKDGEEGYLVICVYDGENGVRSEPKYYPFTSTSVKGE